MGLDISKQPKESKCHCKTDVDFGDFFFKSRWMDRY